LAFAQTESLCKRLDKPQVKRLDNNVYVRRGDASVPLIYWSPAPDANCLTSFASPEDLHKAHPEFSANSQNFVNYKGPLFASSALKNYQLLQGFEASKAGVELPSEIIKLFGLSQKKAAFIGAYPPVGEVVP
jgi:hypothetical protein